MENARRGGQGHVEKLTDSIVNHACWRRVRAAADTKHLQRQAGISMPRKDKGAESNMGPRGELASRSTRDIAPNKGHITASTPARLPSALRRRTKHGVDRTGFVSASRTTRHLERIQIFCLRRIDSGCSFSRTVTIAQAAGATRSSHVNQRLAPSTPEAHFDPLAHIAELSPRRDRNTARECRPARVSPDDTSSCPRPQPPPSSACSRSPGCAQSFWTSASPAADLNGNRKLRVSHSEPRGGAFHEDPHPT